MYKVLVVDDEVWMCEGLRKIIGKLNLEFSVTDTAHDGRQALSKLANDDFDLVITDIRMPTMDGLALMKQMRELHYTQPVVIISAHNEFEYARDALRMGAVDYLVKPVKNEELFLVLTNLQELWQGEDTKAPQEEMKVDLNQLNGGVELVQSIMGIIEHSYMEDLSLAILAEQAGFNSSYLSRLFKMETGKGFVQYLREVRMKHACEMLAKTSLTNIEIAKRVGFWDEKHFRRVFKKDFGLTPGEYREQYAVKN
ncbi:response regulator [Ammoniphilus sp. YIM 78166]|uniref:response regulator transcription factor n=1 Tax=Ammoniphilus sp. YIM 78166 TaxID=1644106 RepID=UPI00106F408B|nr:response regulator [Ammoniphilus sp. YIM 78166]